MPIQSNEKINIEREVEKNLVKEIRNILILTKTNIYWEVWSWENKESGVDIVTPDSKFVKKEFYNCPFSQLAYLKTTGKCFVEEIEPVLWTKTKEINSMPETTVDKMKEKRKFDSVAFSYHTNK